MVPCPFLSRRSKKQLRVHVVLCIQKGTHCCEGQLSASGGNREKTSCSSKN
jgi:hypothetical protein